MEITLRHSMPIESIARRTEDGERILEDFGIWERMIWHVVKGQDIQKSDS